MDMDVEAISFEVIGVAIEVHRQLGPGLLERIYRDCLAYELRKSGLRVKCEVVMPVIYKEMEFESAYRLDLLVNGELIVEIKAVDKLDPVYKAQLLSYLKLSKLKLGLLINFNTPQLKQGIQRIVNNL